MINKICGLISIYHQLQNNGATLLLYLSNRHIFLNSDPDKIQSPINLSNLYFLISLYTTLIQPNRQQFTTSVIVLPIIACFFTDTSSYIFGWKTYIYCFFLLFCGKIVIVIYIILTVTIRDLFLKQNNKKLVTRKSVVQFKPTIQKKSKSMQVFAIPTYS